METPAPESKPTVTDRHRAAMKLCDRAMLLKLEVDGLYYQAGEAELAILSDLTPGEHEPTYSIIARSAVACFFRAGADTKCQEVGLLVLKSMRDERSKAEVREILADAYARLGGEDLEEDEGDEDEDEKLPSDVEALLDEGDDDEDEEDEAEDESS